VRIPLFLVGAIVLIVFAIVATAAASATFLSITWATWLCAAILSFFTHLLVGDGLVVGRRDNGRDS